MNKLTRLLPPAGGGMMLALLVLLAAGCRLPPRAVPLAVSPAPAGGPAYPLSLPAIQRGASPISDTRPVTGSVLLNDGFCCAGGMVGETITLTAALTAASPYTTVTQMRVRGQAAGCPDENVLSTEPWTPFQNTLAIPFQILTPNWVGYYFGAQFRDELGRLSPAVCDDISIEGMPAPP